MKNIIETLSNFTIEYIEALAIDPNHLVFFSFISALCFSGILWMHSYNR